MPSTNNKVKFGLKNCHYAKATIDPDTNAVTFGTPVAIPGAVNLSLDPEGDTEPFYADDMVYYTTVANNGYSGDLEIALIPDSFRKDILKETEDANGVLVEDSTVEPEHFALLFEFSGDKKKIRHCSITVPLQDRPSRVRPMRTVRKYRRKRWSLQRLRFRTVWSR